MGKWIKFDDQGTGMGGKSLVWHVVSKASGALLGTIYWWPKWRQYVFEPAAASRIIFEEDCLRDIAKFIEEKTAEHKAAKAVKS